MNHNSISHWELEMNTPAEMYHMERKKDAESTLTYWTTESVPTPNDRVIPLESIVIFVKPSLVVVPEGISLTQEAPNLVLPAIYLKKWRRSAQQALYLVNIRHFFGPLGRLYKKEAQRYSTHIIRQ